MPGPALAGRRLAPQRRTPGLNPEPAMPHAADLPLSALENPGEFAARHLGPDAADEAAMLSAIGVASRRALKKSKEEKKIKKMRNKK